MNWITSLVLMAAALFFYPQTSIADDEGQTVIYERLGGIFVYNEVHKARRYLRLKAYHAPTKLGSDGVVCALEEGQIIDVRDSFTITKTLRPDIFRVVKEGYTLPWSNRPLKKGSYVYNVSHYGEGICVTAVGDLSNTEDGECILDWDGLVMVADYKAEEWVKISCLNGERWLLFEQLEDNYDFERIF